MPVWLYGVGAALTVLLSFVLRAVVRTDPKQRQPRVLWGPRGAGIAIAILRFAGLAGLFLALLAGILVRDRGLSLAPLLFWVAGIVCVTVLNAVVSGAWAAVNPWATIERFYRLDDPTPTGTPPWWVGPIALYALFWFELVSGSGFEAMAVVLVLVLYSLFVFSFRARWGTAWHESDPLSILFGFAGRCAPLELDEHGLRFRGWVNRLDRDQVMSKAAFASVFVLLGATTLDNVRETTNWHSFLASARVDDVSPYIVDSTALAAFALLFLLPYAFAMWVAAASIPALSSVRAAMRRFAWSLIPIGIAYLIAHNAPLLMTGTPRLLEYLSDPFDKGWNLFGTASAFHGYLPSPQLVWFIEIALIIGGHVLAVLAAHRIAIRIAGSHGGAVKSQIALTVLMCLFTVTTLVLLGQPLVA